MLETLTSASAIALDLDHARAQRQAEERRVQEASAAAIAAITNDRERAMVEALDRVLSLSLGSENGYIPSIGAIETGRLQRVLASYGVTPDYGASIGCGYRVKRYPG